MLSVLNNIEKKTLVRYEFHETADLELMYRYRNDKKKRIGLLFGRKPKNVAEVRHSATLRLENKVYPE